MQKFFSPLILLAILLVSAISCTRNDAQQEFEQEAYRMPDGITETEYDGKVISEDEDDWRISPMFQGSLRIDAPPHPNPVQTSQVLNIEIYVLSQQAVSEIHVYVRYQDGSPQLVDSQFEISSPGVYSFRIDPLDFGEFRDPESARGDHRILIYNGRDQIISYGDVRVEDFEGE